MSELRNILNHTIKNSIGIGFLKEFERKFESLVITHYETCEETFKFSNYQKNLSLAYSEYGCAVESLIISAKLNALDCNKIQSGQNPVDYLSSKWFNLFPYRKGKGSRLTSGYKKQLSTRNKILEVIETDDLFKDALIEASGFDLEEKIFLLLGVEVVNNIDGMEIFYSIDLPRSDGKSLVESIPFSELYENKFEPKFIESDEESILIKLKKALEKDSLKTLTV